MLYITIDFICFFVLGFLLGLQYVHYVEHTTKGTKYSYIRYFGTISLIFVVVLIISKVSPDSDKGILGEIVPFLGGILGTILTIMILFKVKGITWRKPHSK